MHDFDLSFAEKTREIPLSQFEEGTPGFVAMQEDILDVSVQYGVADPGLYTGYPNPTPPTLNEGAIPYTTDEHFAYATRLEYLDIALNKIISNIRIGNRVIYSTPEMSTTESPTAEILNIAGEGLLGWLNGGDDTPNSLQTQDNQFYTNKANFLVKNGDGLSSPETYILSVDTGIKGEVKVADTISQFNFTSLTALRRSGEGGTIMVDDEAVEDPGGFLRPEYVRIADPNTYEVLKRLF